MENERKAAKVEKERRSEKEDEVARLTAELARVKQGLDNERREHSNVETEMTDLRRQLAFKEHQLRASPARETAAEDQSLVKQLETTQKELARQETQLKAAQDEQKKLTQQHSAAQAEINR